MEFENKTAQGYTHITFKKNLSRKFVVRLLMSQGYTHTQILENIFEAPVIHLDLHLQVIGSVARNTVGRYLAFNFIWDVAKD